GELRAEGFIGGTLVKQVVLRTTDCPKQLKAITDTSVLSVGGVAHIDISTLDKNGLHVPDANSLIIVEVEGAGYLKGMDSGYVEDLTPFSSPERALYNGYLMAMVYAKESGSIKVKVSCEGMDSVVVELKVE
ncbi:MAG: beta-galactosidase, partial [Clostridiales bacterium]|nr:beta-galactosidase [Clostridiales bacterium]